MRLNENWLADFRSVLGFTGLSPAIRAGLRGELTILEQDAALQKRMSTPISMLGPRLLTGTPNAWTGFTAIITDEMCASMCDIFTTLMQDHHLAKVYSKRSMGAGGNVISTPISQYAKICLTQTASIMYRIDGSAIENEGAKPDVELATTASDYWTKVKVELENSL